MSEARLLAAATAVFWGLPEVSANGGTHHTPDDGDNEDDLHVWVGASLPLAFVAFGALCFLCGYACGPRSGTSTESAESGMPPSVTADEPDPSFVVIQTSRSGSKKPSVHHVSASRASKSAAATVVTSRAKSTPSASRSSTIFVVDSDGEKVPFRYTAPAVATATTAKTKSRSRTRAPDPPSSDEEESGSSNSSDQGGDQDDFEDAQQGDSSFSPPSHHQHHHHRPAAAPQPPLKLLDVLKLTPTKPKSKSKDKHK
jgi:hypothetical protein